MPYLERVEPIDATRSHWTVAGPAGTSLEWDAEVINEVPFETIGWQSLPGADVANAGSVHFRELDGGLTEVVVTMQYDPPAGRLGASMASLIGESAGARVQARPAGIQTIDGSARTPAVVCCRVRGQTGAAGAV